MSILPFKSKKIENKHHCKKNQYFRGPCEHKHNFHLPFLGNSYLYICARCIGLYGGIYVFSLLFLLIFPIILLIQSLNYFIIFVICFLLTLPLVFDWLTQSKGLRHSSNIIRLLTGLFTSLGGVIMIVGFQAIWFTGTIGLLWFLFVVKIGHKWRKTRSKSFGCSACRRELPEALEMDVQSS